MAWLFLLALVCFLGTGLVLGQEGCVFSELNQGLSSKSWDAGAKYLAHLADISDERECREICCTEEECHLALIETPADGSPQCFLVNCMKDGEDVCVLEESDHSKSFLKTQVSDRANNSTGKHQDEKHGFRHECRTLLVVLSSRQRKPLILLNHVIIPTP